MSNVMLISAYAAKESSYNTYIHSFSYLDRILNTVWYHKTCHLSILYITLGKYFKGTQNMQEQIATQEP